jgi:hypothetical protein
MATFLLILILFALIGVPTWVGVVIALPILLLLLLVGFITLVGVGALLIAFLKWTGLPVFVHQVYVLSGLPLIDHEGWFVYALLGLCAAIYLFWPRQQQQPTYASFQPRRTPMPVGPTSPITFRGSGR